MEFKARYEVIGLFSLAVIAGLFAFVYWLNNVGGFGQRADYRVRFSEPVSGLAVGGGVYFNGIKVGEITRLTLDPEAPSRLEARIAVAATTPVRADTTVGISHEGLTGVADIMLTGGKPDAAPLGTEANQPALLVADPAATRSWSESAGRLLSKFDDFIGKNSERLDGILAGIERMTGGAGDKNAGTVYDLPAPAGFATPAKPPAFQLVVAEPTVPLAFNTDKLQQQAGDGAEAPLDNARLADNLPNIFQARLIQGFENAGYLNAVLRPADATDPDYRLIVDIRRFYLLTGGTPRADIAFVAKLLDRDGKVVAAQPFEAQADAASLEPPAAAAALGAAFSDAATRLIEWTGKTI
jgi:phospholipid/cholesterol/gamma-HCH transport system substrate-binding protein